MEYQHGDNSGARRSGDSGRAYGYSGRERERRERAAAQRRAERERFEQRQRSRHQTRRPSQGTWYEHSSSSRQNARTAGQQLPRGQQRPPSAQGQQRSHQQQADRPRDSRQTRQTRPMQQARRSVPLQHQQLSGDGYVQQPRRPHPPQGAGRTYGAAPALDSRDLIVRTVIVAVLLVIFIARIATFGGCAQSSELDSQIVDQQTQLQQANDSNTQLQQQVDSMQSTIDSYNQLVSSSSSSSASSSSDSSSSSESSDSSDSADSGSSE